MEHSVPDFDVNEILTELTQRSFETQVGTFERTWDFVATWFGEAVNVLSFFGAEFWSAIAGAFVGGVIALWVQQKSLLEARNDRKEQEVTVSRALAYSLYFKVLKIANNLGHLRRHVEGCKELGQGTTPSGMLLPLANHQAPVEFSADEMALLLSYKNDEVFNAVLSLDNIHNSTIPAWKFYAERRERMQSMVSIDRFDEASGAGSFAFRQGTPEHIALYEANELAKLLVERSERDANEAMDALGMLEDLLREKAGLAAASALKSESNTLASKSNVASLKPKWPPENPYHINISYEF